MSSPALRRPVQSVVAFPQKVHSVKILRCFDLNEFEHALMNGCLRGLSVDECTAQELAALRILETKMYVRFYPDSRDWWLTDLGEAQLRNSTIALQGELKSGPARVLSIRR
jgi:hypothetical protein